MPRQLVSLLCPRLREGFIPNKNKTSEFVRMLNERWSNDGESWRSLSLFCGWKGLFWPNLCIKLKYVLQIFPLPCLEITNKQNEKVFKRDILNFNIPILLNGTASQSCSLLSFMPQFQWTIILYFNASCPHLNPIKQKDSAINPRLG